MIFDNVKEYCVKRGLAVSEVERRANLSNGTISKWNSASPTIENLVAVSKVLKVSVNKLIK